MTNLGKSENRNTRVKRRSARTKIKPLKYWCNEWRKFNIHGELIYDSSPSSEAQDVSYSQKRKTKRRDVEKPITDDSSPCSEVQDVPYSQKRKTKRRDVEKPITDDSSSSVKAQDVFCSPERKTRLIVVETPVKDNLSSYALRNQTNKTELEAQPGNITSTLINEIPKIIIEKILQIMNDQPPTDEHQQNTQQNTENSNDNSVLLLNENTPEEIEQKSDTSGTQNTDQNTLEEQLQNRYSSTLTGLSTENIQNTSDKLHNENHPPSPVIQNTQIANGETPETMLRARTVLKYGI